MRGLPACFSWVMALAIPLGSLGPVCCPAHKPERPMLSHNLLPKWMLGQEAHPNSQLLRATCSAEGHLLRGKLLRGQLLRRQLVREHLLCPPTTHTLRIHCPHTQPHHISSDHVPLDTCIPNVKAMQSLFGSCFVSDSWG